MICLRSPYAQVKRFKPLGAYAMEIGADAILFTYSAFGAAIDKGGALIDRCVS